MGHQMNHLISHIGYKVGNNHSPYCAPSISKYRAPPQDQTQPHSLTKALKRHGDPLGVRHKLAWYDPVMPMDLSH